VIAAVAISSHVTLKLAAMRDLSSSSVSTAMLSRKAGGGSSVLKLRKSRSSMRPWIAMVAAYALALQMLLSGLAGAHAMAAGSGAGELFVICHGSGDGPADGQDLPDQSPRPASPCVLCTLTQPPCAILPIDHIVVTINVVAASDVGPQKEGRIIEFDSPTGRYQRGPPASASIFG
jgi:hypothetical protein